MKPTARPEFANAPAPSKDGAAQPAAGQAAAKGKGAADARRVGDEPAAAAAPWRWAPRPKLDPLTQEPEIGWSAARKIQAKRRSAITAAKRLKPRRLKDAGVSALSAAKALDSTLLELERQKCPVEQAAVALRRRGRVVYRLSVHGGPRDTWFCSGKRLTDAELVVEAGKLRK